MQLFRLLNFEDDFTFLQNGKSPIQKGKHVRINANTRNLEKDKRNYSFAEIGALLKKRVQSKFLNFSSLSTFSHFYCNLCFLFLPVF